MCLHRLIDDVLENINENEITALTFLDIRKCLDTIDHDILLSKLKKYGIQNNELKWFQSYLENRAQIVINNGVKSKKCFVNIGVPQGNILDPLLFVLYVNDLSNTIQNAHINVYADDVVIYCSHSNLSILNEIMQTNLTRVFKWYTNNRLTLSIDKCSTMVINEKNDLDSGCFKVYLGDQELENVSHMKYLGLHIDDKLKWDSHIANLSTKVNINNSRLRRARKILPLDILLKIHNSQNVPIIDYSATVWANFSQNNINLINRLEHMSARAITGNYDFVNARGADIMNSLSMKNFLTRNRYHLALLIFKAIIGQAPDHIANNILFTYEVSHKNLRSFDNMNLYHPKPNCEVFKKSLQYSGATVWNSLPMSIKESTSVPQFKTSYRNEYNLGNIPVVKL